MNMQGDLWSEWHAAPRAWQYRPSFEYKFIETLFEKLLAHFWHTRLALPSHYTVAIALHTCCPLSLNQRWMFRQKIAVISYWGWWSEGHHAKSAGPVSRGAKRRTLLPWSTQSGATWLSPRVSAATIASKFFTVYISISVKTQLVS